MLYDRWRSIASQFSDCLALREAVTGRQWTFKALAAEVEYLPACTKGLAFPQGQGADFIFAVLQAWRDGIIVCPLESGQGEPRLDITPPKRIAHLKSTSATTGPSRLVAFTAEQLAADCESIVATMGLKPEWPNLAAISLAHSYGFSNLVTPLLLQGIPLILAGGSLPETVRCAALNQSAICLPAVPALWRAWHDADAIPRNVQLAISAGAPLPVALEQSIFQTKHIKVHNFYGSTECGGIAFDAGKEPRLDASFAGNAMHNVRLEIGDDGCLVVNSRAVGEIYLPDDSDRLRPGVFHTSDLAVIRSGAVHLLGRASDQINVAGRKVAPELIESALAGHSSVRECMVFGVSNADSQRGETIVACLSTREKVSSESLRQFLTAKLDAWQIPREWWFVESLGANERGKTSRIEWRRKYLAEFSQSR